MELLNTGYVTHFHSQTGTFTSIDLFVCTSNSLLNFTWRVLPNLYGSDHFPILLESVESEQRSRTSRWRLDRSDWQRFTDLTFFVRPLADVGTCNDTTAYFTDVLHSAALQSVSKTSVQFPKRPVPWWNADCTAAVREKLSAFSILCRHRGDPLCLEAFRPAHTRARCILKEAQRRSWRIYLSSITFRTPLTAVFNKGRKISEKFSPPPPPVLFHAGEKVADPKTVAGLFAGHFSSVSRRDSIAPGDRPRQGLEAVDVNFASPGGESYNVLFSPGELMAALS